METVKEWQKRWFYITEPRDATWDAAPEVKCGAPMGLTSWIEKGLNWSSSDELMVLQTRIQSMVDKNIKLIDVIQVMLVRRILPCQNRTCPLWEYDPVKHQTLERLFGTTHEDAWKFLFKGGEKPPAIDSDRGHDLAHPANAVSPSRLEMHPLPACSRRMSKLYYIFSGMD